MYGLNILVYTSKMPSEEYVRYKEQEIPVSKFTDFSSIDLQILDSLDMR